MLVYTLLGISAAINVVALYLIIIGIRKQDRLEAYCEMYVKFISNIYLRFKGSYEHIKNVDRLGAFAVDDEVGMVFNEIHDEIEDLHKFLSRYVNVEENGSEEKKAKS